MPPKTNRPFAEELPRLLEERGITLRALAREIGQIDHGYLSRMVNSRAPANPKHAERIARFLGLPADYFFEVREARVIDAIKRNGRLREEVYARLRRRS